MIEERRCSYEVSKLLHEKGFDVKCTDWFWESNINIWKPTHQMACDWLREKGIHVNIYYLSIRNQYYYEIVEGTKDSEGTCNSYGDAVEAALKYVLENLI